MKTLKLTLAAALFAALFAGCVGPEGPEGPQGVQGPQGGNSATFTSNPVDWALATAGSLNFETAPYNASLITQDVIDNGVVAVYFQASNGSWAPLPDTYPISTSSTVTQTMTFNYSVSSLVLQTQNSDNTDPGQPAAAFDVKVVVIPTAILKQHPGFNTKNYQMVKQLLNLKD